MTVEGFDACKDLAVVPAGDQNLCAGTNGGLEDRQGTGGELVLFDLSDFILANGSQYSNVRFG
jgi:hypothetical protein